MTAKTKTDGKQGKLGFEESMARLEKIVAEMEDGQLTLEEMIARFEEGRKLTKSCTETLNEVDRKIEMLVKKGDEVVTEPFDGETTEELF